MKFTLSWLKDHLDTDASVDEIAAALTDLGLEVEGVENPADTLGAFRICRVIEAVQHPDADRLRLCRVEAWPNGPDAPSEEVQVVCGAPNARTGLVGVFAPTGTHIPGTGVDLKPGVIRGVESNGMLCSEREMMISDDHDGIIDLPEDAPLGARFIDYADLNDPVFDIAITPNRPDALGVRGVARDLAARGLGTLKPAPIEPVEGTFKSPIGLLLMDDVKDKACPLYVGRYIRNLKNGPSPDWLQRRLRAIGLRPINALVDVTNFLTYDRARPLHVFDADKVEGGIHVRLSRPGETLLALDGKEYAFDDAMTLICDDSGPEGIGGVMGGEISGCTGTTTNVFIESALFDPVRTAATGRKLKIHSDARYRFERGVDPEFARWGMEQATRIILDICGGEPSELVIAGEAPDTARTIGLRTDRVATLVGMDVPISEQTRILEALGFGVKNATLDTVSMEAAAGGIGGAGLSLGLAGAGLAVSVPPWRPDVQGEADLVEEIARVASLSKLESQPLRRAQPGALRRSLTPMQRRVGTARRALAAQGMNECVTYTFVAGKEAALFGGGDEALRLENPISSEMSDMRPNPLPGLLAAAARNQARGFADLSLFEVGAGFHGAEPGEEAMLAAGIRIGSAQARDWTGGRRPVDFYDAKADAEAALAALGAPVERLMTDRAVPEYFHPGRSVLLKLGPKVTVAELGELHPNVLSGMDVAGPACAFILHLENLPFPKAKTKARPALTLHDLQAVERDFAFVVDARTETNAIRKAARGADKALIEDVRVFDVFEGPKAAAQLGDGKKSVAIAVRMQPKDRTLKDEEIDAIGAKIVSSVEKSTGGTLRG